MEKIKALLSKKVAGIPVVAIVLLFAAVLLWWAIRMRPSSDGTLPDDVVADVSDSDLEGDINPGDQPTFQATPPVYGSVSSPTVTAAQTQDTNDLWSRRVAEYYSHNGYTVDEIQSMLAAYLGGESMNSTQANLRDLAVRRFGYPPENVTYAPIVNPTPEQPTPTAPDPDPVVDTSTPTPSAPAPKPNPTTNYNGPATKQGHPPTTHTIRGTSDDTAAELALLYYPNKTGQLGRELIRGANAGRNWDGPQAVGSKIRIPEWHDPVFYKATSATRTAPQIAAKNGTTKEKVADLNPGMNFPVKVGTRVRVK